MDDIVGCEHKAKPCLLIEYFEGCGKCLGCDESIVSIEDHRCHTCTYVKCHCACPPAIRDIQRRSFTFEIKVAMHKTKVNSYDVYDTLDDAIKGWGFGIRSSSWSKEVCHVYFEETTEKWYLLEL